MSSDAALACSDGSRRIANQKTPGRYAPIQKFAPQDCVASINGIVEKIDQVFESGDRQAVNEMKAVFGLEALGDGDFAQTIAFPSMVLA